MKVRYQRPVSYAALWALRIARFALLMFVAVFVAHRFGPLLTPHFVALAAFAAGLSAFAVLLALVGLLRLWQVAAIGGLACAWALVFSVLPLAVAGTVGLRLVERPAIHDITTDTADPPPFLSQPFVERGWLSRMEMVTEGDREAQIRAYPALTGRRYEGALDRVLLGVQSVVQKSGLEITIEEGMDNARPDLEDMKLPEPAATGEVAEGDLPETGPIPEARPEALPLPLTDASGVQRRAGDVLLQGEWKTIVAGLPFDVVIRLREGDETTFVDLRVASRYGANDLGLGAAFAEDFLHRLDAELLGIAGG